MSKNTDMLLTEKLMKKVQKEEKTTNDIRNSFLQSDVLTLNYKINKNKLIDYLVNLITLIFKHIDVNFDIKKVNIETISRLQEILLFSVNKKTFELNEKTVMNLFFWNKLKQHDSKNEFMELENKYKLQFMPLSIAKFSGRDKKTYHNINSLFHYVKTNNCMITTEKLNEIQGFNKRDFNIEIKIDHDKDNSKLLDVLLEMAKNGIIIDTTITK